MKILFVLQRPSYVRNYASTIDLLARRGHAVHLAFTLTEPKLGEPSELRQAHALADVHPAITFGDAASRDPADGWYHLASAVRLLGDFGRYLHPRFADAPLLRARAQERLLAALRSPGVPRAAAWPFAFTVERLGRRTGRRLSDTIVGLCRAAERTIPASSPIVRYVAGHAPDVMLATPVVDLGSSQAEYFKAARERGLPSGVCVASWDNLTNKGVLRVDPERIFVWNELQRDEAVELHGVPRDCVVATGAQRFDDWFERTPSRAAGDFKRCAGLDPVRPYVLYVCSSSFIVADEAAFVRRWANALRTSGAPELAEVGILVRPHPQNTAAWEGADIAGLGNAAVFPPGGAQVIDAESKADFFDSIAHSTAVVGINTSAQIEACILGKSVLTILAPEFRATQLGTLHYHYLRHENGGFLHEAVTLDGHVEQLRLVIAGQAGDEDRARRFVQSFVRPLGLDVPATPLLGDGIERLASLPLRPGARTVGSRLLGLGLGAVAGCLRAVGRRG